MVGFTVAVSTVKKFLRHSSDITIQFNSIQFNWFTCFPLTMDIFGSGSEKSIVNKGRG